MESIFYRKKAFELNFLLRGNGTKTTSNVGGRCGSFNNFYGQKLAGERKPTPGTLFHVILVQEVYGEKTAVCVYKYIIHKLLFTWVMCAKVRVNYTAYFTIQLLIGYPIMITKIDKKYFVIFLY